MDSSDNPYCEHSNVRRTGVRETVPESFYPHRRHFINIESTFWLRVALFLVFLIGITAIGWGAVSTGNVKPRANLSLPGGDRYQNVEMHYAPPAATLSVSGKDVSTIEYSFRSQPSGILLRDWNLLPGFRPVEGTSNQKYSLFLIGGPVGQIELLVRVTDANNQTATASISYTYRPSILRDITGSSSTTQVLTDALSNSNVIYKPITISLPHCEIRSGRILGGYLNQPSSGIQLADVLWVPDKIVPQSQPDFTADDLDWYNVDVQKDSEFMALIRGKTKALNLGQCYISPFVLIQPSSYTNNPGVPFYLNYSFALRFASRGYGTQPADTFSLSSEIIHLELAIRFVPTSSRQAFVFLGNEDYFGDDFTGSLPAPFSLDSARIKASATLDWLGLWRLDGLGKLDALTLSRWSQALNSVTEVDDTQWGLDTIQHVGEAKVQGILLQAQPREGSYITRATNEDGGVYQSHYDSEEITKLSTSISFSLWAVMDNSSGQFPTTYLVPVNPTNPVPSLRIPPTIKISQPSFGARFTNATSVNIFGVANDNIAVTEVHYRLVNSKVWKTAQLNPSSGPMVQWMGDLSDADGLVPGNNTLVARARDSSGNYGKEVATTFRNLVPANLTILALGSGRILGDVPRELFIGDRVTLVAAPDPGNVFHFWDAPGARDVLTDTRKRLVTVEVGADTTVKALFFTVPWSGTGASGNYFGTALGFDTSGVANPAGTGTIVMSVTDSGAFSFRATLGGVRYAGKGHFDADSQARIIVSRAGLPPLFFWFHLNAGSRLIGGSLHLGDSLSGPAVSDFGLQRRLSQVPIEFIGTYTALIQYNNVADTPTIGFFSMSVDSAGICKMKGVLPNGMPFSSSTALGQNNFDTHVYVPLNRGKGYFFSLLSWYGSSSVGPTFDGNVYWYQPKTVQPPTQAFFAYEYYARGYKFTPYPPTALIFGGEKPASTESPATVEFFASGGDQNQDFQLSGIQSPTGASSPGAFDFTLNRRSGLVTGKFLHPGINRQLPAKGVFITQPDMLEIFGQFPGISKYGRFSITPTTP